MWSQPAINAGDFHRSYVSTYLERDLRSLQQVGNLLQFERFLRACALRSGQLLNRADLLRSPLTGALWETLVVGELPSGCVEAMPLIELASSWGT